MGLVLPPLLFETAMNIKPDGLRPIARPALGPRDDRRGHRDGRGRGPAVARGPRPAVPGVPLRRHHLSDRHRHGARGLQAGQGPGEALDHDGHGGGLQRRHGDHHLHAPAHLFRRCDLQHILGGVRLSVRLRGRGRSSGWGWRSRRTACSGSYATRSRSRS